jgi:hypothetical protein
MRYPILVLELGAHALEFPDDLMLGIYSVLSSRVFPGCRARRGGVLVLLREIRRYFSPFGDILENFEKEAGNDLAVAQPEGPDAVRRLLLSREWKMFAGGAECSLTSIHSRHRR